MKLVIDLVSIPQIIKMFEEANVKTPINPYQGVYIVATLALLSILETVYGFWLRNMQKKQGNIPLKHKTIAKTIIGVTIFLFLLSFLSAALSTLGPITSLMKDIQ